MRAKTAVVLGAQWGDEGKGKIVDVLSERFSAVARYAGATMPDTPLSMASRNLFFSSFPAAFCGGLQRRNREWRGA